MSRLHALVLALLPFILVNGASAMELNKEQVLGHFLTLMQSKSGGEVRDRLESRSLAFIPLEKISGAEHPLVGIVLYTGYGLYVVPITPEVEREFERVSTQKMPVIGLRTPHNQISAFYGRIKKNQLEIVDTAISSEKSILEEKGILLNAERINDGQLAKLTEWVALDFPDFPGNIRRIHRQVTREGAPYSPEEARKATRESIRAARFHLWAAGALDSPLIIEEVELQSEFLDSLEKRYLK